jgi:carnitine monooxygenase subunit
MTGGCTSGGSTSAELHGANVADAAAFAVDLETRLRPSWQFVCHESDLPSPGTAIRFDFGGRSALLLRDRDGRLAAFLNVCRHRGSRLVDGDVATGLAFCVDGRVRCPAHGWTYDARGALVDLPRADRYPDLKRSAWGLQPLDVEDVGGWVCVAFARPAVSLQQHCGAWLSRLEGERTLELRRLSEPQLSAVAANWRLVCADRIDLRPLEARAAPLPLEPTSLESVCEDAVVRTTAVLRTSVTVSWTARTYLSQLAAEPGRRGSSYDAAFIWPNTLIEVSADQWTVTQVLPIAADRSVVREVSYGRPDASRRVRALRYLHRRLRRNYLRTRIRLLERLQTGAALGAPGPVADDEPGLAWFMNRLREAEVRG